MIIRISIITICHHGQRLCVVIEYFPYTVHFLPMAHSFCNLMSVPLNLSYLFLSFPHPPSLLTSIQLFSVSVRLFAVISVHLLCFLGLKYKQNHMEFAFIWHILLSIISSRSTHVATSGKMPFFLWLGNIPLCICTISSLSIHLLMDT